MMQYKISYEYDGWPKQQACGSSLAQAKATAATLSRSTGITKVRILQLGSSGWETVTQ